MKILAIESSCDESAAAVLAYTEDTGAVILAENVSSQIEKHRPFGGVVPELAAREHITNLPHVVGETLQQSGLVVEDLDLIAVTAGPGLKGCLLVGLNFAKGLSFRSGVPLLPVNHLEGHLLAGFLAPEAERPHYPVLSLLVSGGHSELVYSSRPGDYQPVCRTRDDAAGEAFDKIATLLGLPYPGGPELSRAAADGDGSRFHFVIGMKDVADAFSFSGLKTSVMQACATAQRQGDDERLVVDMAASAERAIIDALLLKTEGFLLRQLETNTSMMPASLQITGGVAANRLLREEFSTLAREFSVRFSPAPLKWCTDNAAMIAYAALARVLETGGEVLSEKFQELTPRVDVRSRWRVENAWEMEVI
ncbi:MAG: tRNA (adenosine(37)-N6)-threonylcarbamoyltransferase complex transferase subunit TsaD [bacterium]|nr:tRNA (adenosine(37)-N6)-threonylcarbamoyltransferase complex transferase subunit TsaD [bacterium]